MLKLNRSAWIRGLAAGVLPTMFVLMSVLPAAAQNAPGSPNPPNSVRMTKECFSTDVTYIPTGSFPPGSLVLCFITITLERERAGLSLTDIVAGGGRWPDTSLVSFFGDPTINQYNRQEYGPYPLGTLSAGTHEFSVFVVTPTNLGCYRSLVNEVHLDQAGVRGHIATARTPITVNCTARPG